MTIVSRYTLRQIWAPTLLAWAAISFFAVAGGVQEQITTLIERVPIVQLNLGDISRISLYILPTLFGFIFPVTYLFGIMMSFGRMAQSSELIALKAAGIPLKRVVAPVIGLGAALSALTFAVQYQAQPWAYRSLSHLVTQDLPLRVSLEMLPTGVMHEYGDWRVYIGERTLDRQLKHIVILQPNDDGSADAFYADAARIEKRDGEHYVILERGHLIPADTARKANFETLTQRLPPLVPRQPLSLRLSYTLPELLREEQEYAQQFEETRALPVMGELRKIRIELADRFAFPVMCLSLSLVAAPVAARSPRTGRAANFAAGVLIIGLYFTLRRLLEPPFLPSMPVAILMAQVPNLVLIATGAYLTWRVDRV